MRKKPATPRDVHAVVRPRKPHLAKRQRQQHDHAAGHLAVAAACVAQVKGRGFAGYCDALDILLEGVTERLGEGYENRYKSGQVIMAGRDYRDE